MADYIEADGELRLAHTCEECGQQFGDNRLIAYFCPQCRAKRTQELFEMDAENKRKGYITPPLIP